MIHDSFIHLCSHSFISSVHSFIQVYCIPLGGAKLKMPYAAGGSGSSYIMGERRLENVWKSEEGLQTSLERGELNVEIETV